MEIDIKGGGWRRQASAFDSGNGQRRWVLAFDGGNGLQLWQRWTIETAFNGGGGSGDRWRQQRPTAFDGVSDRLRQEDERAAQGQATQTRGRCFKRTTRDDGVTTSWHDETTRGGTTRRQDNKRAAH
jgi:hypothetical protein